MLNLLTDGATAATKETILEDAGLVVTEGTETVMNGFTAMQANPVGAIIVGAIIAVVIVGVGGFVIRKARRMFR